MKLANKILLLFVLSLLMNCDSNNEYLENGMNKLKNREYEAAITDLTKGLDNDPDEPELFHYGLANCYYYLNDYKNATEHLNHAIAIAPNHRDSYWLMARIYSKKNDLTQSLDYYSKAISLSSSSMLLASRGLIYLRMGENELALSDLDQAIEENPEDKYALSNRGLTKIKLKKPDEARIDLQKSLALDSLNPYVYKHFALLYLLEGDTTEACQQLLISKDKGYLTYGNEIDRHEVTELLLLNCE